MLTEEEAIDRRTSALDQLAAFEIVPLSSEVIQRAEQPFPALIRTLDAIHLATALALQNGLPDLVLATHDHQLARAARAEGFEVYGA